MREIGKYSELHLFEDATLGTLGKIKEYAKSVSKYYFEHGYELEGTKVQFDRVYIGATSTDYRQRASRHGEAGIYKMMVVVCKVRSIVGMRQMEKILIEEFRGKCDNGNGGGGGPIADEPNILKYVYVCYHLRESNGCKSDLA